MCSKVALRLCMWHLCTNERVKQEAAVWKAITESTPAVFAGFWTWRYYSATCDQWFLLFCFSIRKAGSETSEMPQSAFDNLRYLKGASLCRSGHRSCEGDPHQGRSSTSHTEMGNRGGYSGEVNPEVNKQNVTRELDNRNRHMDTRESCNKSQQTTEQTKIF